jgi:hypothetical protein
MSGVLRKTIARTPGPEHAWSGPPSGPDQNGWFLVPVNGERGKRL